MADLETKVNGIKLSENVKGLLKYQYAGVARKLVEARDFNGARAAIDKYAQGTGDYDNLHIAIEALSVSEEATEYAARLYAQEKDKIVERTTFQEFTIYLQQCEWYKKLNLGEGEEKLFRLKILPVKDKTIGDVKKELEEAKKILKETKHNRTTHPDPVVISAQRKYDTYENLMKTINDLLNHNDNNMILDSQKKALGDSSGAVRNLIIGFKDDD